LINIGLIGAGNISDTHARAVTGIPDLAIAAVHAPTRAHAERLAARHGAAAYDALEPFLDHRPLDMVVVGSPSGLHAEHGIAAARKGLHVLVEKPIDVTAANADALIEAAARARVTLGVIFQDRLKPDVVRLKALVESGRLGSPLLATAQVKWYRPPAYYQDSRWRGTLALDGGGALINQGVHTVDLLLWLFGRVRRVYGRTATVLHQIEVEDTALAVIEFASGALGTIEATTAAYPGFARRLTVTGSNGSATLDGDALVAVDLRDATDAAAVRPAAAVENAASPAVSDPSAHRAVIEDFVRAVKDGGRPMCDGAEGRRSIELVEAIYRSSRTGAAVGLPAGVVGSARTT